ncbi:Hypothetical predicted protein [Paramuricea clavata]|uniref:Uncharacterized protein n=1 Tax=Paramuricea clavata TaxID=317549 RepID=A0A7D9L6H7_PARCT|nr:Hypothetical predicted protein [Paramuricea clavata]
MSTLQCVKLRKFTTKANLTNIKTIQNRLGGRLMISLGEKKKDTMINELKLGNDTITSPMRMANCLNDYFTSIGGKIGDSCSEHTQNLNFGRHMSDNLNTSLEFTLHPVNESQVFRLLNNLSISKSTGGDKIPAKILKKSASVITPSLTNLFNSAIGMGIFPSEWKSARVIPLHKKGSRSVLDNYRPISILPVISKIFEKILYEQLYEYFTTNNLLSEQQFGFRRFHSTSTALLDCTDEWYVNMDRGLYNLAVFLDLKKAFDTVNHDILLAKLELYGIKNTPLMLLKSYLSDRSQKCQVNGELSTLKYLKYGVPQGSILGPLLFLIYINDLPNCLQHSTARMFADDTNITVSGKSVKEAEVAINVDLNNIREWLLSNRLSLNLVKTEYLLIGSRHNINTLEEQPRVFIGDEPIKGVQVTKTLGVKIDQFLTWDSHIDQISKKYLLE